MKKLLLTGASAIALLTAAQAGAQSNTSNVGQDGHGQQASVTQTGSNNGSDVQQEGFDNSALVSQGGSNSSVEIQQNGTDVPPSAPAVPGSSRFDSTKSNIAEASQSSNLTNSSIDIQQEGNNLAIATQRGFGLGGTSDNQNADIVQSGNLNRADTDQRGDNLQATASQSGNSNSAFITQQHVVVGAEASISQTGDNNYADTFQTGDGAFSTITQSGDANKAEVLQTGDNNSLVSQNGDLNEATVSQNGSGNSSTVNQTGNGNSVGDAGGQGAPPAIVGVTQTGNDQVSNVNQTASGASATVNQSGAKNNSDVQQTGAATAKVVQQGSNGLGGYTPDAFPNNRSLVTQTAGGANADVFQNGTLNRSNVTQNAAAEADVIQNGTYNNSVIDQQAGSAGAQASVTQGGDYGDNRSSIVQSGDSTATVTQFNVDPAPPASAYPGNESDILQQGSNNVATVGQTGDDNRSVVNQLGSNNVAGVNQIGNDNSSLITQNGSAAAATVNQTGNNSNSTILQKSGGVVTVNQSGSTGSTSNVTTEADSTLAPPANTVLVNQTDTGTGPALGQANVSDIVQDNVNLGSSVEVNQTHNRGGEERNYSNVRQGRNASNGDVIVTQNGGDNFSNYTSTTSTDNDATIVQNGANNNSDVQQDFQNGGARADVNQNNTIGGADNSVFIDQISAGFSQNPAQFAIGATAEAVQNGAGNLSTISQTGFSTSAATSNFARSNQQGDGNTSNIGQSGVDNSALLNQTGSGHVSDILQGGNGNTATVTQNGVGQNSMVNQSGNNNVATVTQGNP